MKEDSGFIYKSYWQGGERYGDIISPNGKDFKFSFDNGVAMRADYVWSQLKDKDKFKNLDLNEIYGNGNNLNVEIGCGNGEFISHYAKNDKNSNWLGFEVFKDVYEKAVSLALDVVKSNDHNNIRLIQFDAELFVRMLPDESVTKFFINFPDPWPKAKHTKRRIIKPWFIDIIAKKLIKNGKLIIMTDHDGYAEEISEHLSVNSNFHSAFNTLFIKDIGDYYKTKYYRKFAEKGNLFLYEMIKG